MTKSTQPNRQEALRQRVQAHFRDNPDQLTVLVGKSLEDSPRVSEELRKAVGADAIKRAVDGDVTVWAELMVDKPELFRERPLSEVEDLAWEELLTNGTPAQRGEPSSAPSSETKTS